MGAGCHGVGFRLRMDSARSECATLRLPRVGEFRLRVQRRRRTVAGTRPADAAIELHQEDSRLSVGRLRQKESEGCGNVAGWGGSWTRSLIGLPCTKTPNPTLPN